MTKVHKKQDDNYMALMKYVEIHVSDEMITDILQASLTGGPGPWHYKDTLDKAVLGDSWVNAFLAGKALTVEDENDHRIYTFTKNDFFIGVGYLLRNYPKAFCLYRLWNNTKINGGHETLVFQIHSYFDYEYLARIGNYIMQYAFWHDIRYPAKGAKLGWELY